MSLAPWRAPLARALHRNRSLVYSRYVQLATVQADGRPANRTVVFRGFLEDSNQLKFVTDTRSQKAEQIPLSPWSEVCWYFPTTREQFRIAGRLTLVGADHPEPALQQARKAAWQALSSSARSQFAWPNPGQPRLSETEFNSLSESEDPQPLPQFCLLLLQPDRVDHLELRGSPQNRWIYLLKEDRFWYTQEVNP